MWNYYENVLDLKALPYALCEPKANCHFYPTRKSARPAGFQRELLGHRHCAAYSSSVRVGLARRTDCTSMLLMLGWSQRVDLLEGDLTLVWASASVSVGRLVRTPNQS